MAQLKSTIAGKTKHLLRRCVVENAEELAKRPCRRYAATIHIEFESLQKAGASDADLQELVAISKVLTVLARRCQFVVDRYGKARDRDGNPTDNPADGFRFDN